MIGRAKQRQIFTWFRRATAVARSPQRPACCSDYAARANLAGFAVGE